MADEPEVPGCRVSTAKSKQHRARSSSWKHIRVEIYVSTNKVSVF